jgi:hypothetical protein
VKASSRLTPAAVKACLRASAMLASTASPSAPPIMNDVFATPEARPASLGATSLMAASSTGLSATATPTPSRIIAGSTSKR